jgi:predicted dienelactone hydrolase
MSPFNRKAVVATLCLAVAGPVAAQNPIDGLHPDAPALAAYGPRAVGVRTFQFTNPDQVDVIKIDPTAPSGTPVPRYDRPLTVEMWYPAIDGATGDTTLDAIIRDGVTEVELRGRAVRDAAADRSSGAAPLVVMSHGYPGNRYLMSHLAENIASKGYVVASIDHTDSDYTAYEANGGFSLPSFESTLVNRSLDQLFVLDEVARLGATPGSDLEGVIDSDNAALIGYSMGGYGAIVTAGGGLTTEITQSFYSPGGALAIHEDGSATHDALPDPRIKTAIAIGPWGRQNGFWDAEGLAGVQIPMMFIGGSDDQISQYEDGIRRIWEETSSVDRALLTFEDGSHNTVAPMPVPQEAIGTPMAGHYIDDDWDTVLMNNVGQHFATAWLDSYLKGDEGAAAYLDLAETFEDGAWLGFSAAGAERLRWETLGAGMTAAPVPLPSSLVLLAAALGGIGALGARRRAA